MGLKISNNSYSLIQELIALQHLIKKILFYNLACGSIKI